jgi:hypothetical protein
VVFRAVIPPVLDAGEVTREDDLAPVWELAVGRMPHF